MIKENVDRNCEDCTDFKKANEFYDAYDKKCKPCRKIARQLKTHCTVPDLEFQQLGQSLWRVS